VTGKERIARRIAREFRDGFYVNLGIGLPTMIAGYVPAGIDVMFQSEHYDDMFQPEHSPDYLKIDRMFRPEHSSCLLTRYSPRQNALSVPAGTLDAFCT